MEVCAIKVPKALDYSVFEALLAYVDGGKRERILRFFREEDRVSSLFADLLIRSLIVKKTGLKNNEIRFGRNRFGKPYLMGHDNFHFNLSHSGSWVVAAVDSAPVGIDVEQIKEVDIGISRSFFSDDEHRDLMNHSDKNAYFFTLWSLKESYIKNQGKGLSLPLDSFSIRFIKEDRIVVTCEGKPLEDVTFAEYHLHSDYKMFLCACHNRLPKQVTVKTVEQLLNAFASC